MFEDTRGNFFSKSSSGEKHLRTMSSDLQEVSNSFYRTMGQKY